MIDLTYWYCSVRMKGLIATYSYISNLGKIDVGSYVEVPFGSQNWPTIGVVESCNAYDEGSTPFPIERTKQIIRIATFEEYENSEPVMPYPYAEDADDEDECDLDSLIEDEDWDEIMRWAENHYDSTHASTLEKVARCFQVCVEQNMPVAALDLGSLYYTGRGVAQDYAEAFRLYQIAADAGELRGICNLGYCHYYGRTGTVDYEKAYHYFALGALLFDDANCLYKLGDMYQRGYHVETNPKYAYLLYTRALKAMDDSTHDCMGDIQLRIGKCSLYGIGTAKDVERANGYLHTALLNFYRRRKTDPFVGGLIASAKALIAEAEALLDAQTL